MQVAVTTCAAAVQMLVSNDWKCDPAGATSSFTLDISVESRSRFLTLDVLVSLTHL